MCQATRTILPCSEDCRLAGEARRRRSDAADPDCRRDRDWWRSGARLERRACRYAVAACREPHARRVAALQRTQCQAPAQLAVDVDAYARDPAVLEVQPWGARAGAPTR